MFLLIVYLECGDWSSISGMLSRMRGLELNVGDFELNVGDFDKKREIFRGDRGMPRDLVSIPAPGARRGNLVAIS